MRGEKRGLICLLSLGLIAAALSLTESPGAGGSGALATPSPSATTPPGSFRASRILDHEVRNGQGETVGEVDDLILRRNGKVKKAILSVGPFLGVGDRLVAVPFRSLKIDGRGSIIYRVSREQLEQHPEYIPGKDHPYGIFFSPSPPRGPSHDLYPPDRERYYPYPAGWVPFSPDQIAGSSLLGMTLIGDQGEPVGKVDDLIIGLEEGSVEKIILSVNEIVRERQVVLPFRPLQLSVRGIYYQITKRQVDLLPEWRSPE